MIRETGVREGRLGRRDEPQQASQGRFPTIPAVKAPRRADPGHTGPKQRQDHHGARKPTSSGLF